MSHVYGRQIHDRVVNHLFSEGHTARAQGGVGEIIRVKGTSSPPVIPLEGAGIIWGSPKSSRRCGSKIIHISPTILLVVEITANQEGMSRQVRTLSG